MLFSKACQYAIRAMTYLAKQEFNRICSIQEISRETAVPAPFLSKIVSTLSRSRLIEARRGPRGGAMLSRPPDQITVGDILEAIDGPLDMQRCVLGLPECTDQNPCPLHIEWKNLEAHMRRELHTLTLIDLVQSTEGNIKEEKLYR
jgi:Rrf2 family protein